MTSSYGNQTTCFLFSAVIRLHASMNTITCHECSVQNTESRIIYLAMYVDDIIPVLCEVRRPGDESHFC